MTTSIADILSAVDVRGVEMLSSDYSDRMAELEDLPEADVSIGSLVSGVFLRQTGTDAAHVQLLADAAVSVSLPPILVQEEGLRVIDGLHRIEVAKLRGQHSIRARLVSCTDEEALILAIRSNTLHGLPLSKKDRISGAKRVLEAHPDWSDRAVAEIAGLSAKTIASLRNRSAADGKFTGKRLGRDGKRRPITTGDGRKRAIQYITAHPEAPLREVAREVGISLGTAHDVRERMRRGTDQEMDREVTPEPCSATEALLDGEPSPPVPVRAKAPSIQQPAWSKISSKLVGDPALKYSEGGRAFLRWMSAHCLEADEWRPFIDAVPMHWRKDIGRMADSMSCEWRQFAEQLRSSIAQ